MSAPRVSGCVLLRPDAAGLAHAARTIEAGGCVAFPTETVYGLGADALRADAVLRVFEFKGRPLADPLICHCADVDAARALLVLDGGAGALAATPAAAAAAAAGALAAFDALAARFWPGPLTLVARAVAAVPRDVTAGTGFVGVRVPAHPVALALLRALPRSCLPSPP